MAEVTFRSYGQSPDAKSTTCVIVKPVGLEVGDLMIAHVVDRKGGVAHTAPLGWTEIRQDTTTETRSSLWQKIADADDVAASNFTFTVNTATSDNTGMISAWYGHDPTTPINANNGQGNASSTTITSPGITPGVANCMILLFCSVADDTTQNNYAIATANPASWSERYDYCTASGEDRALALGSAIRPETSATGNGTATASGSAVNIGQLVAIAPSSGDIDIDVPLVSVEAVGLSTTFLLDQIFDAPTTSIEAQALIPSIKITEYAEPAPSRSSSKTEIKINNSIVSIVRNSLTLNSRLSERISTAIFEVIGEEYLKEPSLAIAISPALGGTTRVYPRDEVQINRGMTPMYNCAIALLPAMGGNSTYLDRFFGGYVTIVDRRIVGNQKIYSCQCQDYNSQLYSILIDESYSAKTEAEIIEDLFLNYWPEIDTSTYVDGINIVASIQFPDIYLSEALQMLADMFNKQFYIDYDKKLHYFIPSTSEAPFTLSNELDKVSTIKLICNVLSWTEDSSQLINRVVVKGDETVPVEVIRTDNDSYDYYGDWFDYVHIDRNINTTAWAELVGDSILEESAFEKITARIKLWQEGLVVGQKVYIEDTRRGIDDYYLIQALQLRMIAPYQEEINIDVGDYSMDLIELLRRIDKLERAQ